MCGSSTPNPPLPATRADGSAMSLLTSSRPFAPRVALLAPLLAGALLVPACTVDPERVALPDAASDPAAAGTTGGDQLTPDRSPMTITRADVDQAIERFVPIAEQAVADGQVPGMAIGVVYDDEVVWTEGFGVRKVGEPDEVGADTVFQIASLSKAVGSTVVAGLVGRGALDWDDPVVQHTPEFALADPWVSEHVTVADLYSHRSGLPDHGGDLLEDLGYDRATILERLRLLPLDDFRSSYHYTNFGLTQGALAAAAAAGGEWEDLSETVLYEPAGMVDTSSRFADYESSPRRAWTHVQDEDGSWAARYVRQPDAQTPAGGVSSTVADLAQWMRLELANGTLDGNEIIDGAAMDQTHTPHGLSGFLRSPDSRVGSYGLGFNLGTDGAGRQRWSHSGAFALGAGTSFTMVPAERLGVVVLTNGMPTGVAESMTETFLDLVLEGEITRDWMALYGPSFQQMLHPEVEVDYSVVPDDATPARELSEYVGTYDNDFYGPVDVTSVDGVLMLAIGPKGERLELSHFDGDTFSTMPAGENATGLTGVIFDPDAEVPTVRIEYLDEQGLGTFTRP